MNKIEDFLLDILAIMPVEVLLDEDSVIQEANLREQLIAGFEFEGTETIRQH
ncbi:MAG: hypothetical protein KAS23_08260 [Anaerohalosphaera sp.]|nr:hypothetical protein [Anaerohalosphaera sp.]